MGEKKRVFSLIFIMAASVLIVAGVAISTLYRTAFKEQQARLVETAQSQARLIEAVARFDEIYSKDYPGGSEAATLHQIIDAHEQYAGFGKTGEFTLSKKEEDNIVFLLSHRHFDLDRPRPVPFQSELAEPMRRALLGHSGTIVGLDYRGEVVMAAHEPVAELDLGIVAKIDLLEIRAPFLKAGAIAGLITIVVVLAGASLFIKITNPMIRQYETRTVELETMTDEMKREIEERILAEEALAKSEEKYRNLFEHANDSIFIIDPSSRRFLDVNENAVNRLGYTRDELLQLTVDDISTPEAAQHSDDIIRELLNAGHVTFERTHLRKDKTKILVEISSRVIEYGDQQVFQSIARDITDRKRIEDALQSAHDNMEQQVKIRTAQLVSANKQLNAEIEERKTKEKKLLEHQVKLRSLSSELLLTEERERRHIATELHDRIGQNLAVTKIKLGEMRAASVSSGTAEALDGIRKFIEQTIQDTRSLTFELSPPVLYELGLEAALAWLVNLTREKHGLQIEFNDDGQPKPLDNSCRGDYVPGRPRADLQYCQACPGSERNGICSKG
jgi:PAS domain S-box-containing protein